MTDVFTFGESMVIFQTHDIGNLEDLPQIFQKVGGAESNFATGLSRLGHQVSYMSKIGNDPFGRRILKSIRAEGIDASHIKVTKDAPTGLLFKEQKFSNAMNVYYYRKNSAASRMTKEDLPKSIFKDLKYLHITGVTPALSDTCRELVFEAIEFARQNDVKVIFDPNLRFKLWDKEEAFTVLNDIAKRSDYILAGIEEASFLTNQTEIQDIFRTLQTNANQIIVIKRGSDSTLVYENGNNMEIPVVHVDKIVDPVGAGDAFAAGFVHGLLLNNRLDQCVRYGNVLGSRVIQQHGDVEGLPSLEELNEELDNKFISDVRR
ncbi:sugar kinase [Sporosarcina cascadiensis]|uniref:sugar kinase n=1 Tax=Sporosarcina cascadiensis TaxID=2660747 RepID=UPI00129BF35F|nr:sugar kinase [Sporosarcina cascadiensis]